VGGFGGTCNFCKHGVFDTFCGSSNCAGWKNIPVKDLRRLTDLVFEEDVSVAKRYRAALQEQFDKDESQVVKQTLPTVYVNEEKEKHLLHLHLQRFELQQSIEEMREMYHKFRDQYRNVAEPPSSAVTDIHVYERLKVAYIQKCLRTKEFTAHLSDMGAKMTVLYRLINEAEDELVAMKIQSEYKYVSKPMQVVFEKKQ
jgi:hypothetical protein